MLTKEARAAFTRAAGVFIFYLTHCAADFSKEGKRQTIYASDIKNALRFLSQLTIPNSPQTPLN